MSVNITKIEGNARTGGSPIRRPVVIGTCENASTLQGSAFIVTSTDSLFTTFGRGPGPRMVGKIIDESGDSVVFIPMSGSVASVTGSSITITTAASTTPLEFSASKQQNNYYDFVMDVVTGGATTSSGGVKIKYSLNGGLDYSNPLIVSGAIGTTLALPNSGAELKFTDGSFTTGDKFYATLQPRLLNDTDVVDALTILKDNISLIGGTPKCVIIAQEPSSNATARTITNSLNTKAASLESTYSIRTNYLLQGRVRPTSTSAASKTADAVAFLDAFFGYANTTGIGISIDTNYAVINVANGENIPGCPRAYMPTIYVSAPRFCKCDVSTIAGYLGTFSDVTLTKQFTLQSPSYDEFLDGELYSADTNRFISYKTDPQNPGLHMTSPWTRCSSTSTFNKWHKVRVANLAADLAQRALNPYQNTQIPVLNDGTGRALPTALVAIESDVLEQLNNGLLKPSNKDYGTKGYCSAIGFDLDREHDMSDNTLVGKLTIVPLADIEDINISIAFNRSTNTTTVTVL